MSCFFVVRNILSLYKVSCSPAAHACQLLRYVYTAQASGNSSLGVDRLCAECRGVQNTSAGSAPVCEGRIVILSAARELNIVCSFHLRFGWLLFGKVKLE